MTVMRMRAILLARQVSSFSLILLARREFLAEGCDILISNVRPSSRTIYIISPVTLGFSPRLSFVDFHTYDFSREFQKVIVADICQCTGLHDANATIASRASQTPTASTARVKHEELLLTFLSCLNAMYKNADCRSSRGALENKSHEYKYNGLR